MQGRMTAGHPVDVATGSVYVRRTDVSIPGHVGLTWAREYSTSSLSTSAGPIGPGWTTRYFARLIPAGDDIRFVNPEGGTEVFRDALPTVDRGETVHNFGTHQALSKEGDAYIVTRWSVDDEVVERYRFERLYEDDSWSLAAIEDVTGQGLNLLRDRHGRLTGIQQRLERRTLQVDYTSTGRIDSLYLLPPHAQRQILAGYEYDDAGRLISAYDALGHADHYHYDPDGRLIREVVKDGGVFAFRYDVKGRCIHTAGLDRFDEKSFRYIDALRCTEVTDSLGHVRRYQCLPSGQVATETGPTGTVRHTEYDEHGRIVSRTDENAATTRYQYDDQGNRCAIVNALGQVFSFEFDDQHLIVARHDPLGRTWKRAYDAFRRLIRAEGPDGARWQLSYDASGNLTEIVNPLGHRKRRTFANGVLVEETDWSGHATHYTHDAAGRIVQCRDPLGNIRSFHCDPLGRLLEAHAPDGTVSRWTYDENGNTTSFTDGNGHTTRFRYGPCRRLLERSDAAGGSVRYVWSTEPGVLLAVINERGEATSFEHDSHGRVLCEEGFDGSVYRFAHDAVGNCIEVTNPDGDTISVRRDALGRVVEQVAPDGSVLTFAYDAAGHLVTATTPDITVRFERDAMGRILRETQGEHWVDSRYDLLGNLVRTRTSLGHDVSYTVNAEGRLETMSTLGETVEFKRDARGQETLRILPGRVQLAQHYDATGRLTAQRLGSPDSRRMAHRMYEYDRNGLLRVQEDDRSGRIEYVFDPVERLLQAGRSGERTESFEYDAVGNITHARRSGRVEDELRVYESGNRLRRRGGARYEYDRQGRLVKRIEPTKTGKDDVWTYQWDPFGRLRAVTLPDRSCYTFKYDALGRRCAKIGPTESQRFLWDRDVIAHAFTESRALTSWIFDPRTFVPLACVQNGQLYSVISDNRGTPRELVDSLGRVVWAVSLTAWGEVVTKTSAARGIECPIRFQGQWADEELGLHYTWFRYYDPTTGRFVSPDPLGLDGGLNGYCSLLNPVEWSDPFGLNGGRYHGPKPTYVNPGHHDPSSGNFRGGGAGRTSILPPNAQDLYRHAIPDSQGKHWYAVGADGTVHIFRNGNDGTVHWAGDSSQGRGVNVPPEVQERIDKGQYRSPGDSNDDEQKGCG